MSIIIKRVLTGLEQLTQSRYGVLDPLGVLAPVPGLVSVSDGVGAREDVDTLALELPGT